MPVMGPENNESKALRALEEILELLKTKYGINPDQLANPNMFQAEMDAEMGKLKKSLLEIFKIDAWDAW